MASVGAPVISIILISRTIPLIRVADRVWPVVEGAIDTIAQTDNTTAVRRRLIESPP
jgi:hypothetical protein